MFTEIAPRLLRQGSLAQALLMRSKNIISIVGCHAEGEVGDVIVGGVAPPPGRPLGTIAFHRNRRTTAQFRSGRAARRVFRHVNLLVPAKNPRAQMGFIIMEPEDTPPMSGSNAICVATVLLDTGIVPMVEPVTLLTLEAPAGLVEITAQCSVARRNGSPSAICRRLPTASTPLSRWKALAHLLWIPPGGAVLSSPTPAFGFDMMPDEAREIAVIGMKITAAANAQFAFATACGLEPFLVLLHDRAAGGNG